MTRTQRLLKLLNKKDISAMIVTDRKNVYYLSGFYGTAGYLAITPHKKLLVTDFRYTEQAKAQAAEYEVADIKDFKLEDFFGGETVAFENETISYAEYTALSKKIKNLVCADGILRTMRSVKDPNETEYIKKAVSISDKAFEHILKFIKPGVTENEIAAEIEYCMRKLGAERTSFDTIAVSGAHTSRPHAQPTDKKIKNGEFVVMDFGCTYKGYCSDMTRTIGVGGVSDDMKKVYNTVLNAQTSALKMLCEGVTGRQAHMCAEDIINKDYKGTFGHALGHGVGLDIHEHPNLSPKNEIPLVRGNVVTVEPGIYIPDFCGVRIEDMGVVTQNGFNDFTKSPKELIIV